MKTIISLFVIIFGLSLCVQAKSKNKNVVVGYWKLVKAETNMRPNPEQAMDRVFEYKDNGTFEGTTFQNGLAMPSHHGKYFLANDSTIICINSTPDNKLSPVSFTYNFHVKNDSLHLYGIYFTNKQGSPNLLQMNYINEWWVKPTTLYKKK